MGLSTALQMYIYSGVCACRSNILHKLVQLHIVLIEQMTSVKQVTAIYAEDVIVAIISDEEFAPKQILQVIHQMFF